MKKISTFFIAAMCNMASLAQGLAFQLSDGTVLENGTELTVAGHDDAEAMELHSGLCVKNLTSKQTGLYVKTKAISGSIQVCFGGTCVPLFEGMESEKMGVLPANEVVDLLIGAPTFMVSGYITRKIEVTAWLANAVDEKVTITLTFTNDPALSVEEVKATPAKVYAKDNVLYCQFADAANRQLQVYNVAGNLCKDIRLTSESESLPLEGMAKGVYIYRVMEARKKAESGKFLVK
ncbi:MAG: T9SS type A sorting domain-containing protein [Bacteroidaceae bacterium]|nr:T9SS type A sorting domain-containing protein [Bacteroidaceae bacterium]